MELARGELDGRRQRDQFSRPYLFPWLHSPSRPSRGLDSTLEATRLYTQARVLLHLAQQFLRLDRGSAECECHLPPKNLLTCICQGLNRDFLHPSQCSSTELWGLWTKADNEHRCGVLCRSKGRPA